MRLGANTLRRVLRDRDIVNRAHERAMPAAELSASRGAGRLQLDAEEAPAAPAHAPAGPARGNSQRSAACACAGCEWCPEVDSLAYRKKTEAQAEAEAIKIIAEAEKERLTPEYLQKHWQEHVLSHADAYWGDSLPKYLPFTPAKH